MRAARAASVVAAIIVAVAVCAAAGKLPWQRRIGRNVDIQHKLQHERVTPEMWPPEPVSPPLAEVDAERLTDALLALCGPQERTRLAEYAGAILDEAARFGVDPFLVGALIYDRSECLPKTPDSATTYGLTRIDVTMHAPHIRNGEYRYFVRGEDGWEERRLRADAHPFNRWKAATWRSNIYWTAAILHVLAKQCPSLDAAFPEVLHRHAVSHWFFGDNVKSIEPEDRVLAQRRRLLGYYRGDPPAKAGSAFGVELVSPLDGTPRLVLDSFGNRRGKKRGPGHQGIDLVASRGEPVRAVAPGRVVFAGVDLSTGSEPLTPESAPAFPLKRMGKGGLYVIIHHGDGLRSLYMHLDTIAVRDWDEVEAGQIVGTVGRTGTVQSGAHLHLELRNGTQRINPAPYFRDVLVDPDTMESGPADAGAN
ncbi:MAG: M23 family metallopeptidase [Proteobacteria bacterium]|jgi:murein DD-endopeptidase MepM/ murein hydrolase activator NlpD|nr:M23 family metallopeptidase [Pseudomonadota bacterium]